MLTDSAACTAPADNARVNSAVVVRLIMMPPSLVLVLQRTSPRRLTLVSGAPDFPAHTRDRTDIKQRPRRQIAGAGLGQNIAQYRGIAASGHFRQQPSPQRAARDPGAIATGHPVQALGDTAEIRLAGTGGTQVSGPGVLHVLRGDAGKAFLQPHQVLVLPSRQVGATEVALAIFDGVANQQAASRQQTHRGPD